MLVSSDLQLLNHQGQSTLWNEECQRLPDLLGGHRHGHARVTAAAPHELLGATPDCLLDVESFLFRRGADFLTCIVWPIPRILKLPPGWRFSSLRKTSLLRIAESAGL